MSPEGIPTADELTIQGNWPITGGDGGLYWDGSYGVDSSTISASIMVQIQPNGAFQPPIASSFTMQLTGGPPVPNPPPASPSTPAKPSTPTTAPPTSAPLQGGVTINGSSLITPNEQQVLSAILKAAGLTSATVSRGRVTPAQQARTMYENLRRFGVPYELSVYGPYGDQVIGVYQANRTLPAGKVIKLMTQKIYELGPANVSESLTSDDVFDIAQNSIPRQSWKAFEKAVRSNPNVRKLLIENRAFHIELRN